MNNLRLIKGTNISSSVTSISITNVFTSDFNIYKIIGSNIVTDSGTNDISIRLLDSSSSAINETSYAYAIARLRATGANEVSDTDDTKFTLGMGQSATDFGLGSVGYIINPFESDTYTYFISQSAGLSGTEGRAFKYVGALKKVASATGIQIIADTQNITQARIEIYGLRVD